jgi:hypothetical protein
MHFFSGMILIVTPLSFGETYLLREYNLTIDINI